MSALLDPLARLGRYVIRVMKLPEGPQEDETLVGLAPQVNPVLEAAVFVAVARASSLSHSLTFVAQS